ncbi:hypothetical protein RJT34_00902 [Clitoria ternatea]|uniref:Polymerase nucleotidyl transferase domain-containing protein n=1 Tax=Clitoria ternatea TaxID=43366 RepID=A0AAN9KIW3_CLITE
MDDNQENLQPSSQHDQLLPIDEELWLMAEQRAQEILCTIQPNVLSEVNRKDIIDYVQRLIRGYYGNEVFTFGSVPLKTYLPDGDIDLTALSHENVEDDLARTVCSILESGDDPEYPIKDIQHIRAQVQLVKCTVKNIAVDISFNQMAGLYALRFLDQIDHIVGKDHLFKRSIILIKAWCYYESRILGAHHGLLSTYAVETLVLYIINRFHASVLGPLEVLYRFLDYYSTFDWDHNYIGIYGPVALSTLPEIAEIPESDRGEFLLQKEFLRNYRDMCSFSARSSETVVHEFPTKFMNILDPLRDDNNLGRSVSRANLHRIRFALSFGARKLKQILALPGENMGAALEKFFMSTLERNGKGQRPDVAIPVPAFGTGKSEERVLLGDSESYYGGLQFVQGYRNYAIPVPPAQASSPSSPSHLALSKQPHWTMYYPRGTDVYVPAQTLYHPSVPQVTYGLEEMGISRGTGTYIPMDLTHNVYWDMRPRASRPKRFAPTNYNALPKSPPRMQQVEAQSEETNMDINMNIDVRKFELSSDDFPILPGIPKSEAPEPTQLVTVHSQEKMNYSKSFEPSNEYFHSESSMSRKSKSFELSNEEFPILPSFELNVSHNSKSFELSTKEFPVLQSTHRIIIPSKAQESSQLTKHDGSSLLSDLNIEFGSCKNPQPLTRKDEKEDSYVSSTHVTTKPVVPKVAMEGKEETPEEIRRWIDSI